LRGAAVGAKDKDGLCSLSWASKKGHEQSVKLLLDSHADVNSKDKRGQTALHWTAKRGHVKVVQTLSERGAVVDERDNDGQSALWWARKRNHETVIHLFIQLGACLGDLWWGDSVEEWQHLLDNDIEIGGLLAASSTTGYAPIFRHILQRTDINMDARGRKNQTALLWAADEGHEEAVQLLSEDGRSDIKARDSNRQTALLCASKRNFVPIASFLISRHANMEPHDNYWLQTPPAWATKRGNHTTAKLLLEQGANVHTKNKDGQTPLILAAIRGYQNLVILFIRHGANLEEKDKDGLTATSYATKAGYSEIVDVLAIAI
jgi:ankyrin repeat protein